MQDGSIDREANVLVKSSMVLPLLLVCTIGCGKSDPASFRVVAMVGRAQISSVDVSYKMAVEKAYGNERMTETAALVSLVNDVLESEVGRKAHVTATREDIAAFSTHVDETSKAPETLEKVKRVFGDDRAAYERIYLSPKIMNRKLRAWYSRNAEIHERERALIERAYSLARSGKSLEEAAEACGLTFSTTDHENSDKPAPSPLNAYIPENNEPPADPMRAILERLDEGEIHENIVEDDAGYKVVQLVQKNNPGYTVNTITAKKRPFTEWFRKQAARVEVRIADTELQKEIVSKYPNVWWVKRWCRGL